MEKQRIEFIDLAKGICIILVVMGHCGIDPNGIGIGNMQMPLFFLLSGIFFKSYGSFCKLLTNKVNRLIIPCIGFFIVGECKTLLATVASNIAHHNGVFYSVFRDISFTDGLITHGIFTPIWFLLALFWCTVVFYFIYSVTKRWYLQVLLSLAFGVIGCYLSIEDIYFPFYIGPAFTAMPFFCLGFIIKPTPILQSNRYDKIATTISIALIISYFAIVCNTPLVVSYFKNYIDDVNMALHYIITSVAIIAFLQLCKQIKYLPYISYIGKNTITVLSTHMLLMSIIVSTLNIFGYANLRAAYGYYYSVPYFISVMALSTAAIPFCKRYLPYLVGQKDLIKSR